jgi:hypothetical protein
MKELEPRKRKKGESCRICRYNKNNACVRLVLETVKGHSRRKWQDIPYGISPDGWCYLGEFNKKEKV